MEVLGTGSAILAVAELSLRLFEACDAYYQTVKGASNEIKTLRDHAGVFNTALKALNALATSSDAGKVPILAEWMQDGGPRDECAELLTDLLAKLAKQGDRKEKHSWLKNLDWPLKKEDMENGINTIGSHRESLVMALGSDNLTVSLDTNRVATMIRDDIAIKERENLLQKMLKWIPAVDTSVNHKEARRKHQAGTGDWLFQLEEFSKWKTTRGSVMWLSGMLGCGKTILR
ncbi:hypothetical protein BU16DRAFT_1280 [Lophium mytilinum]|uniref:Nephrocystin 3-like N-terminal domain-containing protein n=1 Tax=Lophium mytilinum TaxID=390894 RepID=A0A6A6REK1_9PEZI|nr:hypothetical protein BU16DRAFT_1280 [Lophium mytilinum]